MTNDGTFSPSSGHLFTLSLLENWSIPQLNMKGITYRDERRVKITNGATCTFVYLVQQIVDIFVNASSFVFCQPY